VLWCYLAYLLLLCQLTEETDLSDHLQGQLPEHLTAICSRLDLLQNKIGEIPVGNQTVTVHGRLNELERKFSSLQSQGAKLMDHGITSGTEITAGATAVASASASKSVADSAAIAEFTIEKLPIIEGVITVLNRELEKMSVDMEALERQRRMEKDLVDGMDRKIRSMERLMAMKDATINELTIRLTSVEQTSYDGTLLWRVSDVKTKRQEALSGRVTSVYSPPFFTSRTGAFNVVYVSHIVVYLLAVNFLLCYSLFGKQYVNTISSHKKKYIHIFSIRRE